MAKKKDINLSDLDANFVISSFKNKERRNNPSAVPKALVPEQDAIEDEEEIRIAVVPVEAPHESRSGNVASYPIMRACSFRRQALRHAPANRFISARSITIESQESYRLSARIRFPCSVISTKYLRTILRPIKMR